MPFRPGASEAVAHALHLMALAGAPGTAPAYARLDRRARQGARHGAPPPALEIPPPTLALALARSAPPAEDASWFHWRWSHGEADAMAERARTQAAEANEVPHGGLLPDADIEVLASTALRFPPFACSRPWRVALGHEEPGAAAVLAVVAERLRPDLPLASLDDADAHVMRLHAAGTALARAVGGVEALRPWLWGLSRAVLPPPGVEPAPDYDRWVERVAGAVLDQPPGEVQRIGDGLARRVSSRLERAWRRGFFLPPTFDLDAWLASTVG